jgi:hypothetical protein
MQSHEITIGNEKFSLKSDVDADHVAALVKELRQRYDSVNNHKPLRAGQSSQSFRFMVIVALELLEELHRIQADYNRVTADSIDFAEKISGRIDKILINGF